MKLPMDLSAAIGPDGAPAAPSPEEVWARHDGLASLVAWLPAPSLSAAERRALGPHRYPEAPRLVHEVLAAAGRTAEPPPAARALCEDLSLRMERALSLRSLERLLTEAARRAGELALLDEASAVADATALVLGTEDDARAEAAAETGGDEPARRLLTQLRPARDLLARRAEPRRRGRRAQAAREAAARRARPNPERP